MVGILGFKNLLDAALIFKRRRHSFYKIRSVCYDDKE